MTAVTCSQCQRPLTEEARFCPSCGMARPASDLSSTDERRLATVVIGDLVGFTTLSEQLDPEVVKHLVDVLFSRLAEDVTSHGGIVDKVVGDSIVALFGAPVAHEDDPERAVRAALAMQHTVERVATDLRLPLRMRIGVNTGEVLVGGLSTGDRYTAMGDAVNVASRLEQAAAPGRVLVGPDTHAATAAGIDYTDNGPVTVRGRAEPVHTWTADGAIGAPGHTRRVPRGPAVGRVAEGRLLDAILDVVVSRRRAHVVEISGESGVGKRHLAEAFAARARQEHDAIVLTARIPPYGEATMWAPAADMLRGAIGADVDLEDSDTLRAVIAGLLDEPVDAPRPVEYSAAMCELFDGNPAAGEVEKARTSALAAIVAILTRLAQDRPIVCVLSNTQWADAAIVELMTQVLVGLRRSPVVAITTSRGEMDDHRHAAEEVAMAVNATWLRLAPLDDDAAAALARALLGPDAPPEVVAAAVRRSGGNPLMLEEIAALAEESGTGAVETMPMTLRGLASARLDALETGERRFVEHAAMIGYTGPLALLRATAEARGEVDVAGRLEAMQDQDLFVVDATTYRFKTDALREAAYLRLPKAERVTRHADIGRRMSAQEPGSGTSIRRRAQHLATAAELAASIGQQDTVLLADAVDALTTATEWSGERDPAVSLAFVDRALALGGERDDLRLLRARALIRLGRLADAESDAQSIVSRTASPAVQSRALTVVGEILQTQGRLGPSAEVLASAVELAKEAGDDQALAEAQQAAALTWIFQGANERAREALDLASAVFRRLGDTSGEMWCAVYLGWVAFNVGDFAATVAHAKTAQASFAERGDVLGVAFAGGLIGWTEFMAGNLVAARAGAQAAIGGVLPPEVAGFGPGLAHVLLASVALWEGHTAESLSEARTAVAMLAATGHRWAEMLSRLTLARALSHAGHAEEAMAEVAEGLAIAGMLDIDDEHAFAARTAGAVLVHLGEPDRAAPLLADGPDLPWVPALHRTRALAALQRGDVLTAAAEADLALAVPMSASVEAANNAVGAFVHARSGSPARAEALADEVDSRPEATFQDRVMALLARAWVASDQDDNVAVAVALAAADAAMEDREDVPTAAVVRVARARLLGAPQALADVVADVVEAGGVGQGWLRALDAMGDPASLG